MAAQAPGSPFADLFLSPTIDGMLALKWGEFEDFIQYVFECAGHVVKKVSSRPKHNVDLVLFADHIDGKVLARVEVRQYATANIHKTKMDAFIGALHNAGPQAGFLITTSGFTKPAYEEADKSHHGKAYAIDGTRLIRYIRYVHGSRLMPSASASGVHAYQPILEPFHLIDAERIPRRDSKKSTVLAVANNRGGVAKTTTAVELAFVLTEKYHQRVLLVDMDSQSSLTAVLPAPGPLAPAPPPYSHHLSEFFDQKAPLQNLVESTRFPKLWLLAADEALGHLDKGGAGHPLDEITFANAIHDPNLCAPGGGGFDWIIIDTPPAQTYYTRLALAASHYVLFPANPEVLAVYGAQKAVATAKTMRAFARDGAQILGFLITRAQPGLEADKAIAALADLARGEGTVVLKTRIPVDYRVGRGHQRTAGGWFDNLIHQSGPAAKAYQAVVKEVLLGVHPIDD